jgi:hypothetical protein
MEGRLTSEQGFQLMAILLALASGMTWLYASRVRVEAWRLPGDNVDWDMPRITHALAKQSRWNARAAAMSALAVIVGIPDWVFIGRQIEMVGGVAAAFAAVWKFL